VSDVNWKTFLHEESLTFKLPCNVWQNEFNSLSMLLIDLNSRISLESGSLKMLMIELLGPRTILRVNVELEIHALPVT
jgi:hypothetical protein